MEVNILQTSLADFNKEKTLRFDVKFHRVFTYLIKKKDTVPLLNFFTIIDKRIKIENLDLDNLKYVEIGSCDEYGDVYPFDLSNKDLEVVEKNRLLKKIQAGDIQKPNKYNLLIPAVRPNLKKFIFIDDEKSELYFTKAFLCLESRENRLSTLLLSYLLRTILLKTLVGLCREGKGYPTIKKDDLKFFYIEKELVKKILNLQPKLLEKITSNTKNIKKYKGEIKKLREEIDQSMYQIINSLKTENLA